MLGFKKEGKNEGTIQCLDHLFGDPKLDDLLGRIKSKSRKARFTPIGTTIHVSGLKASIIRNMVDEFNEREEKADA